MDFEEASRRLKLLAAVCVLGYGGWWLLLRVMSSSVEKTVAEHEESREPREPERVRAATDLGFKDPAAGLAAMRAILAAPRDAAEKELAQTRLPSMLVSAHRAAGKAKDWSRQAALWAELDGGGSDASRRRLLIDDRAGWLAHALEEGDEASADLLAAAMRADTARDEMHPRQALDAWRRRRFGNWRDARAAKDAKAAAAALEKMASWEPLDSGLARDMAAIAPAAELLAQGKTALRDRSYAAAALLLRAAAGDRDNDEARRLLDDAVIGLAADPAHALPVRGERPEAVDKLMRVVGPRRAEARARAGSLMESWGDSALAAEPARAASIYEQALELSDAPSGKERLATKAADAKLSASLAKLRNDLDGAFADLRPLLRDGKDAPRKERALSALRDAWRKARDENDFDRLVDLSAFWISEAGAPPFSDPFRAELKSGLMALADGAKKQGLNKQVFALSLFADAYPDDPEARDARREATARGAMLARETMNRGDPPAPSGPSGLPGRTVALVENGTAHHILMLYEGPESFFVRINPFRRGTVVLKDGAYLIGVAAIKDEIVPYAMEAKLASSTVNHRFVVVHTGSSGSKQQSFGFSTYGHWTLLRAPEGEKPSVDPQNGLVR